MNTSRVLDVRFGRWTLNAGSWRLEAGHMTLHGMLAATGDAGSYRGRWAPQRTLGATEGAGSYRGRRTLQRTLHMALDDLGQQNPTTTQRLGSSHSSGRTSGPAHTCTEDAERCRGRFTLLYTTSPWVAPSSNHSASR